MYQVILMIHMIVAICLIALVLVQQGRGANVGAAFGSGASQTVFGSRGSGSFLLKVTIGFGVVFFSTSLWLNHMVIQAAKATTAVEMPLPQQQPQGQSNPNTVSPNNIPVPGGK